MSTARSEKDLPEILSGYFEGKQQVLPFVP